MKVSYILKTKEKIVGNNAKRHVSVSGGKKCPFFREIWRALFSSNTLFEILSFALLPTKYRAEELQFLDCF